MDASTPSDEELVQRALDGDDAAMELILHRYKGAVHFYTSRYFCRYLAEEVAQDTFLKAAQKLATFKHKGSLEGWLLRICERCCIDRRRREQRQPTTVDLDDAGDHGAENHGDAKPILSLISTRRHRDEEEQAALHERLEQAINALPVEERLPVSLVCIHGFSQQAAAEILDIPATTLRDRLIRGRRDVAEKLDDYRRRKGRSVHA
jgi:RNA polymerase sigma-70 factor (ECF subfamily)